MWDDLRKTFNSDCVDLVKSIVEQGEDLELWPESLAADAGCKQEDVIGLLDKLTETDLVEKISVFECPKCKRPISPAIVESGRCDQDGCNCVFEEEGDDPALLDLYVITSPRARQVKWFVVIHGMNTKGDWQQDLSWQLSQIYRYSIPVAFHKYGHVILGAFLQFRIRRLVDQLAAHIGSVSVDQNENRLAPNPPDIVAHSLGTLVLGRLLEEERYRKITLGRIILAGCILRPDYNWEAHIADGRVEAVLNHTAEKDFWARVAHYFIPGSGPAGRRGFNEKGVFHLEGKNLTHSAVLESDSIKELLGKNGYWERFLTLPSEQLGSLFSQAPRSKEWLPKPWILREATRWILLLGVAALALLAVRYGDQLIHATAQFLRG